MRGHPRFGPGFAVTGLVIAVALIGLNLARFPDNPGQAGLVDIGPLVGLCYLVVALRMGASLSWLRQQVTQQRDPPEARLLPRQLQTGVPARLPVASPSLREEAAADGGAPPRASQRWCVGPRQGRPPENTRLDRLIMT